MSTRKELITKETFDNYKKEQELLVGKLTKKVDQQNKKNKRFVLYVIIFSILFSSISAIASYSIGANNVTYTPTDNSWQVANTKEAIDDLFDSVGAIYSYMGNAAPHGYLACDRSTYRISDYPRLAGHIQGNFGSYNFFGGDGTTTFAVPDLRGEFLRGSGTNSHTNQGNGSTVGTHQDATNHINFGTTYYDINWPGGSQVTGSGNNYDSSHTKAVGTYSGRGATDNNWSNNRFYTSRPTNTSVLYIIKY